MTIEKLATMMKRGFDDVDKKIDRSLKEQRKEFQRYVGAVAEDFASQVKLVSEILLGQQQQLTAIRDMVVKNAEDIEVIKMEMFAMKQDIVEMKKDIAITKSDIEIIKQHLRIKIDVQDFEALERRVTLLEAKK